MDGDFDIDFRVEDESFWKKPDEPSEPDESDVLGEKYDKLFHDLLHHNLVHLEKHDIEQLVTDVSNMSYYESETLSELVDHVKYRNRKIKWILLFVNADAAMSKVIEAIEAIKLYCTEACVNGGKILCGSGDASLKNEIKYRILYAVEPVEKEKSEPESVYDFPEDIPF